MKTMKTMAVSTKADGYEEWIRSIKERIQRARVKASMPVNSEQTLFYWDIGHDILEKQDKEGWGSKVVERMSKDLKAAFPDMKGWSRSNLMYMRQFVHRSCLAFRNCHTLCDELSWSHYRLLISIENDEARTYYTEVRPLCYDDIMYA